jgi:hypothetical protein
MTLFDFYKILTKIDSIVLCFCQAEDRQPGLSFHKNHLTLRFLSSGILQKSGPGFQKIHKTGSQHIGKLTTGWENPGVPFLKISHTIIF